MRSGRDISCKICYGLQKSPSFRQNRENLRINGGVRSTCGVGLSCLAVLLSGVVLFVVRGGIINLPKETIAGRVTANKHVFYAPSQLLQPCSSELNSIWREGGDDPKSWPSVMMPWILVIRPKATGVPFSACRRVELHFSPCTAPPLQRYFSSELACALEPTASGTDFSKNIRHGQAPV